MLQTSTLLVFTLRIKIPAPNHKTRVDSAKHAVAIMQAPVMVLNSNTKRETGKAAQLGNIAAAKAVADIIRTTLGPRSMLKMLLDPMGGIVMTNDGNCILREVDVSHPAAKSMIELSRAQDEEVGDGTTSVIILSEFWDRCHAAGTRSHVVV